MTNTLLISLAHSGSKEAEQTLMEKNIPLVKSIAARFLNRGLDMEDLCQIGCVGMLKAIRNFDVSMGVAFSTYAVPLITGEIKRYFRDNSFVKVSRSMRELAIKAFAVRDKILASECREATVSEIALMLGADVESVVTAMTSQMPPEYLYKRVGDTDTYMIDTVKWTNSDISEDTLSLRIAMTHLSDDEKYIVKGRYFEGKTQKEVADTLGISQVQISRKEKRILSKLRGML